MNRTCPDSSVLESVAKGGADPGMHGEVEAHCQACAGCAARLQELRDDHALVVALLEVPEVRSLMRGRSTGAAGSRRPGWPRIEGFDLVREIGAGGMGVVFEATQSRPQRRVAVKVLAGAGRGADPASLRRLKGFVNEGEALAQLSHPNIAGVHCCGQCDNGDPFIAMELVEGETLDAFVRRSQPKLSTRLELLEKICRGVQHAHQRGVVHLDLKPANVIVDAGGEPKVVDFGLARRLNAVAGEAQVTRVGVVAGTAGFMSPEQARGDGEPDSRSDVYALGALAFACLAGAPPPRVNGGPSRALRSGTLRAPAEGSARMRRWIESILARALEEAPHERYLTAGAMADDIQRCRSGVRPLACPRRVRPALLALGVAAMVTLTASAAAWLVTTRAGPAPAPVVTPKPSPAAEPLILGPGLKVSDAASMEEQAIRVLRGGPPYAKASSFSMMVYAMILDRRGEHSQAETVMRAAASIKMDVAPQGGIAVSEARLARVLAASGKNEECESLLRSAERRVSDREGRWGGIVYSEGSVARSRLMAQSGDRAGAIGVLQRAFSDLGNSDRFGRSGARSLVAIELAGLVESTGDAQAAAKWRDLAYAEERKAESGAR